MRVTNNDQYQAAQAQANDIYKTRIKPLERLGLFCGDFSDEQRAEWDAAHKAWMVLNDAMREYLAPTQKLIIGSLQSD